MSLWLHRGTGATARGSNPPPNHSIRGRKADTGQGRLRRGAVNPLLTTTTTTFMSTPASHVKGKTLACVKSKTARKMPNKTKKEQKKNAARPNRAARRSKQTKTSRPAISNARSTRTTPAVISSSGGLLRVKHRELFRDQASHVGTGFNITYAAVTPSSSQIFPWLSQMATMYQCYRWNGLRFIYEPSCPTTTAGTAYGFIDYNYHDAAPESYSECAETAGFKESPVFSRNVIALDRKQLLVADRLFTGAIPTGADAVWYRTGTFFFGATTSSIETIALGRWYVEYDISFMTPQPPTTVLAADADMTTFEFVTNGSATNIFGTTSLNADSGTGAHMVNGKLVFDRGGDALVTVTANGTGGLNTAAPTATVTGTGTLATLTDTLVATGTKATMQFLVQNIIAGVTTLFVALNSAVGLAHTDISLGNVDVMTAQRSARARATARAEQTAIAERVVDLLRERKLQDLDPDAL